MVCTLKCIYDAAKCPIYRTTFTIAWNPVKTKAQPVHCIIYDLQNPTIITFYMGARVTSVQKVWTLYAVIEVMIFSTL